MSEVISSYLDELNDKTHFDVVADFAALFPVEIISSMLGVPAGERQQIRLWTDEFLHREPDNPNATESGVAASAMMQDYSRSWPVKSGAAPTIQSSADWSPPSATTTAE